MKYTENQFNNDVTSSFGTYALNAPKRVVLAFSRLPVLCRGWARPSWIKLLDWLRPGAIDFTSTKGVFRLYPKTNLIESGILLRKDYNQAEIDFLEGALAQNAVFIDIGANIGLYTVSIAKTIAERNGKVIAIEPNPVSLERLHFNLQANQLSNVSIHAQAVGDYNGKAKLDTHRGGLAIVNTVRDDDDGDINVKPLQEILEVENIDHIDALKIDIEGYEYRALQPFFKYSSPKLWPKRISIEHLGDKKDIEMLLIDCGYVFKGKTRCNAFYQLQR